MRYASFWMGLTLSKYSPKKQKMRFCVEDMVVWDVEVQRNLVVSGVNGVVVDRHGLILRENDATGVRKVFRYLPGLRDLVTKSNMGSKVQTSEKICFSVYFCIF